MPCIADAYSFVPTITNPLSAYHPRTKGCQLRLRKLSAQLTTPIFFRLLQIPCSLPRNEGFQARILKWKIKVNPEVLYALLTLRCCGVS